MNTAEFLKRIDQIMGFHDISASVFADTIGVQRSGISHLLAGRNKPSLEFVLKVVAAFPNVDLYCLLYGEGVFPREPETTTPIKSQMDEVVKNEVFRASSSIDKIIIFYTDGSFKSYSEKGV